jgi:hypothetical protein
MEPETSNDLRSFLIPMAGNTDGNGGTQGNSNPETLSIEFERALPVTVPRPPATTKALKRFSTLMLLTDI